MRKFGKMAFLLVFASVSLWGNERTKVELVLDDFHLAASQADGKRYFGHFAQNGVFIGTDATERWTRKEFKAYAEPHFSKGKGWTYLPGKRNIGFAPGEKTAWFDEILESKSYGVCRGTGVLVKEKGEWKIIQYHLTIPVPNSLAKKVVSLIKGESN